MNDRIPRARKTAALRLPVKQESANLSTYLNPRVVRNYAASTVLFPAEQRIIELYSTQFRGDVLDIAIGAGRTTRVLLPVADSYVGVDFASGMIAAAKAQFPRADLRCTDMRNVPKLLGRGKFDAILISFNGIDYIPWEDRNILLRSLRGMLRPGGILAFSTHDLSSADEARRFTVRPDLQLRASVLLERPLEFFRRLLRLPFWCALAWRNHRRLRKKQMFFDGYAYLNDSGDNFGLLTTYTATELQVNVLKEAGYIDVQILQPWLQSSPTSFNYFVCRI
jgi:SAM-dependent methyltransferase